MYNTNKVDRLSSGKYRARYSYRGKRYSKTFLNARMAQAWLDSEDFYIQSCERNGERYESPKQREAAQVVDRMTLNEWFDSEYMQRTDITHSTKQTNSNLWLRMVRPYIGEMQLTAITKKDVLDYATHNQSRAKSKDHAATVYKLLSSVLNRAVKFERIQTNPCQYPEFGRRPKPKQKELLTTDQLAVVLREVGKHYELAIKLAAACSLRVGEWSELRKKDVQIRRKGNDPVAAVVHIERSVSTDKGKEVIGKPKTEAGIRSVSVPNWLVKELAAHVDALPGAESLLFIRPCGKRITRQSFNKVLTRAGRVAGYVRDDLTTHQLRHFGATEFLRAGGNVKDVQARLGHTTSEMAMRYLHASQRRDEEIANSVPVFVAAPDVEDEG
ncbi:tyrosine-type recombinase/integrase [Corynebacterium diphtheriae]|uniref:tyrosine-type recombinase/integrase n=1 Tax=Corynebacterium diphtheriae TaxID=1717 RepID=UPI0008FB7E9C|nr:site-specific integrase [Corynebacterium diphtheriae]